MPNNPFKLPGSELLRIGDSFLPGGKNNPQNAPKDKPPGKPKGTGLGHGGGGGRRKPAEAEPSSDLEALDMAPAEETSEEKPKEPEAILSSPAWAKSDTLFHEEAEVCVSLALPPGKEHLTRVEVELFAKRQSGPELISKSEGNAGADGVAKMKVATFLPKNFQGEAVEYYLIFKHKLAKATNEVLRKVQEMALKSADHSLVPGIAFDHNTSFINPKAATGLKALESKVKEWEKQYPKGKIVIFGHANPDEEYGKLLSERRAESAYAFITNDADTWEKLYNKEKWGIIALQHLLKDLGHFDAEPINKHGPRTTAALKEFQSKSGLKPTGEEDTTTRKALFTAYMKGKHDIKIDAGRFRQVAGNPWMGCSANNRTKDGDKPSPENRRVAFILINESKIFPVTFPCQDGAEAGCAGQCKRPGKRSTAGVKCAFYDELLREKSQERATESESKGGALKKGDKGPAVEEVNIRLVGFGGGVPKDEFDDLTEAKVMRFQKEWMKESSPTGIVDSKTASAMDEFAAAYPLDIATFKCKCGKCDGFGSGQYKGEYSDKANSESRHKYEYPGIHRSLIWALRAIKHQVKAIHIDFHAVNSAYRCWEDNKKNGRSTTNHMGKALDLAFFESGKNSGKPGCDKVRALMVEKMDGQVRWGSKNKLSMEPSDASYKNEYLATTWVHFDVREYDAKFLDDRFFANTIEAMNGKKMKSLLP